MLSLKATIRKYIVALLLAYTPFLLSVVLSYYDVLPKYLIDYKVPTIVILLILPILYSYILVLKNHIEDQYSEIEILNKKSTEINSGEKKTLISSGKFQFDKKFGFYKNLETGELFCTPCLLKDIPAQLKEFDDYWRCTNCGHWYYKEHYKPFQNTHKKDKGDNWATNW